MKKLGNKGMTLVEVMAAMVILAIVCGGMLTIVVTSSKTNTNSSDKQFAANQASNITQLWLWHVKNDGNNFTNFNTTLDNFFDDNLTNITNSNDNKYSIYVNNTENTITIFYSADKKPIPINNSQIGQSENSEENFEFTNAIYKIVIKQDTQSTSKNSQFDNIISIAVYKSTKGSFDSIEPFYKV